MEIEVEDLLKQMLNLFQNTDKQLKKEREEETNINQQQQDILHYIEATNLNGAGYAKAGKMLKNTRQKRRTIKNRIERLVRIKDFTTKYNNKMILGDLIQLLKDLGEIEKTQCEPKYYCRTNILDELEVEHEQIQK